MSLRSEIQALAHELDREDNAAFDLWTWLPSYRECRKHHGDQYHNFTPAIADVMIEATMVLASRKQGAGDLQWFECPCGEPHEGEGGEK